MRVFGRRPASETHLTREPVDIRPARNQRFTLKTQPLTRAHRDDRLSDYRADHRQQS